MEKKELLQQIKIAAESRSLSKEEVLQAYDSGSAATGDLAEKTKQHATFSESIQYLGSGIVFIGIALLVANRWETLNIPARILITLGVSLVAFTVGVVLLRREQTKKLAYSFILISVLVMPVGVYSIFNAFQAQFASNGQLAIYEACMVIIYTAAFYALRLRLYLVPITIFATALFFTIGTIIAGPLYGSSVDTYNEYRFLIVGLSYVLFGYYYTVRPDRIFSALFYIFGIIALLGSAIALSGFESGKTFGQGFWEIFFPILALVLMYFGALVKQTKVLVLSTLFLMGYVIKVSGEYFSQSLGWPVVVVLAGLIMIGIGYFSVYLTRKYLKTPAQH